MWRNCCASTAATNNPYGMQSIVRVSLMSETGASLFALDRQLHVMKLRIFAKVAVRVVGTLAGLPGLGLLFIALLMLYLGIPDRDAERISIGGFLLAFAAYFLHTAYLAWFRFSPLAVRRVCGALCIYGMTFVTEKLLDVTVHSDAFWPAFAFLGCVVAVYIAYRFVSNRLRRLLFPESVPEPVAALPRQHGGHE